jgi:hypothetical protein
LQNSQPVSYSLVATLPICGRDFYRPELFLRLFDEAAAFDPRLQAIYILEKKS